MENFDHWKSQEKEKSDQEIKSRVIEAARFSFADLSKFLNSDKEVATIEQDLTFDDLESLKRLSYEAEVLRNQYGTFSWKGNEEEARPPTVFLTNRDLYRAMFRSHIFLDLHNHPTSVFSNDRSFPGPVDMTQPRTHDIIVVGKEGISVTSPILRNPTRNDLKFLHDPQMMYGTFLRGAPSYYSSEHYAGNDWLRFLEAAGVKFSFYPWDNSDDIRRNIIERAPQDGGYLAWIDSNDPYQRAMALSVFESMYSDRDCTVNPNLFGVLERFCNDSEPLVRDRANETLKRIKANQEHRHNNPE